MNDLIGLMGSTNDRPTAKTIEVCPKSIGESDLCAESNFTGELVGRSESSSKFRVKNVCVCSVDEYNKNSGE